MVVDQFLSAYHEMVDVANEAGEQARTLLVSHATGDSGSSAQKRFARLLPMARYWRRHDRTCSRHAT